MKPRLAVSHRARSRFVRRGLRSTSSTIRHREIRHSRDLEMIEVVAPAGFKTYAAAPAARRSPGRR